MTSTSCQTRAGFGESFRNRDFPYSKLVADYPGAENLDQVGQTIW